MRSASAAASKQDVPTPEEQMLYINLCILGIAGPNLRVEGVELGRTCFRRSNNKALEHVLIRLFTIIEGKARAQKEFKGMLPMLDKVQQAPFYQKIGEWLNELKKAGRLEPSVILPVSALKTNTSSRLVLLLLELSQLALHHDLESTCPGACRAAHMPSPGPMAPAVAGITGFNGLVDDSSLVPAEVRLGITVVRAKEAASVFLEKAATAARSCDAVEQRCREFTRRYYELQADLSRTQSAQAEAATVIGGSGEAGQKTPRAGSPSTAPGGSSILFGPAAQALASSFTGFSAADIADQQPSHSSPKARKEPSTEQVARVSALVASLNDHLRTHHDLSKVLMTEDMINRGSIGAGGGVGNMGAVGLDATGGSQQGGQPVQRLHPHQIDGAVLAADAVAAAAAAASDPEERSASQDAAQQRRQQKGNLLPFRADGIMGTVLSFSSVLRSLAPHIIQLSMAVENGPPPMLQPPSKPSSHAAHAAHQLQVHKHASTQVMQLRRKAQEELVACEEALQRLRAVSGRVESSSSPDYDFADDEEPQQHAWRHPYPEQTSSHGPIASGRAAMAAQEAAAWRPPVTAAPQTGPTVSFRGGFVAPPSPTPVSALASPSASAPPEVNEVAWLQARMRNLQMGGGGGGAPTASAASLPSMAAAVPAAPGPAHSNSTATSGGAWDASSPGGATVARSGSNPRGSYQGALASPVPGSPTSGAHAVPTWLQAGQPQGGGVAAAPGLHPSPARQAPPAAAMGGASPGWQLRQMRDRQLLSPSAPRALDAYLMQPGSIMQPALAQHDINGGAAMTLHAAPRDPSPARYGASSPAPAAMGPRRAQSPAPVPSVGGGRSQDLSYLLDDDDIGEEAVFSQRLDGSHRSDLGIPRPGSSPAGGFGSSVSPIAAAIGAMDVDGDDDFGLLAAESERLRAAFGSGVPSSPMAQARPQATGFSNAATPDRRRGGSSTGEGPDVFQKDARSGSLSGGVGLNFGAALGHVDCGDDVQRMDVDMAPAFSPQASPKPASSSLTAVSSISPSALPYTTDPKLLALKARMQAVTNRQ